MATYPFSAVVGADDMMTALILTAVAPVIGGVLVRGEKGTAKSTAVRGLAALLPDQDLVRGCRFACDPAEPDPTCPDGPHPDADASLTSPEESSTDADADSNSDADSKTNNSSHTVTRPARLVELPVGATEDRVVGSLDLEQALAKGRTAFEPGLLAAAHRGILYVDEVNLLHDHLVDLLLDAAAMGRCTVEREGISLSHAARIVLIGTMNPEEGELRPQLLDRFGLTAQVGAPREPVVRAEVVRRRMAYDADPVAFARRFATAQDDLRRRIAAAQRAVVDVRLGDRALLAIAHVCAGFEVDGMRADLVTARAAVAHAAWCGRDAVTREDIRAAARLALPHRRRRNPFDAPGLDEALLDALLDEADPDGPDPEPEPPDSLDPDGDGDGDGSDEPQDGPDGQTENQESAGGGDDVDQDSDPRDGRPPGDQAPTQDGPEGTDAPRDPAADRRTDDSADQPGRPAGAAGGSGGTAAPDAPYRARLVAARGIGRGAAGKRSRAETSIGKVVGVAPAGGGGKRGSRPGPVHLPATIRAAAPHQPHRGRDVGDTLRLTGADVRRARTEGRESNLILLTVDASGSMAARRRMSAVKGAVLALLLDAYQRRDKVGLVTFRGECAELMLPPTSSVDVAARRLAELPHGGRTPLAEGLAEATRVLALERLRDPQRRPLLVVVTDGRATSGAGAIRRANDVADHLREAHIDTVVVDCESGRVRLGLARQLAARLGGEYLRLEELAADALVGVVHERTHDRHSRTSDGRKLA